MQVETEAITKIFDDPEVSRMIQTARDGRQLFNDLSKNYGFKPEMVDKLYAYAKFQYECGTYSGAAEYLYFVRVLVSFVRCLQMVFILLLFRMKLYSLQLLQYIF